MSMNKTNPSVLFGGTWEQIVGRFLLCDATESKQTGGSNYISIVHMPPHSHTFSGTNVTGGFSCDGGTGLVYSGTADYTKGPFSRGSSMNYAVKNAVGTGYGVNFNYTPSGNISSTGNGQKFLPQYMTCYCWYRTA